MSNISVIGAGSWGSALAQVAASNGDVTLWTRSQKHAAQINAYHINEKYLPSISLSHHITATSELETALKNEILLIVTPAQSSRQILTDMKPLIRPEHMLVLCSKGIELGTGMLMSDVTRDILPNTPIAILSGPNFAHEIAAGKPAATTLACTDEKIAKTLQKAIASASFRPYISGDIIGAQIAGALKNVIAIACGIAHGLDMGESARASLVTRGLAEISRLGVAMGANQETFLGLCGVGDMMLTCSSEKSRNFSLGYELGQGKTLEQILDSRQNVTEGVHTAKAAINLANKYNIEMPISLAVHKCLNKGLPIKQALQEILTRPLGYEI